MEMNEPLVSIAMATYNGAKYLHEQIDSIISQTYKNIEIVIVDDGSSDGTPDIVRDYESKFPFIHLHVNEKNAGVTNSFAKAISLCNGNYIALSDQDDYWLPHKIETLLRNIGDHDAIFSNSLLVNEKRESLGRSFTSLMNMKSYYNGAPFLLSNSVPGHTILVKTDFVKSLLPFPSHVYFDLWIGFNAASNNGIKFIDEVLVHYRQHESNAVGTSMSKNARVKRSVQQQFNAKKFELETLATAPIKDERTKKILEEMIRLFHRRWSFSRSAFFFRNYSDLLLSKQKPGWRKKLFCVKMFFKPNF
jgi:glycosyltransferase involved in cell wall biosynthesis